MLKRPYGKLAWTLWRRDLKTKYDDSIPGYEHRVRFQVLTEYSDIQGPFVNFKWWAGHELYVESKKFPHWAVSVVEPMLKEPSLPRFFTYTTVDLTSIDAIQEVHEFCVSQGFTPVFVRNPHVNSGFWPKIAVDREEDALLLANYCATIGV